MSKPKSIYQTRSDGINLICTVCDNDKTGVKYCEENNLDFSHGICPSCAVKPVPNGQVFPEHKPAGFLMRNNIKNQQDMEDFLNGEKGI